MRGAFLADDADEISYIANHWVTLDDNQMFTGSAGAAYKLWGFLFTGDAIWGSGYRRGFANSGELPPILQFNAGIVRGCRSCRGSAKRRMAPEHDQCVRPHLPDPQRHRHRRVLAVVWPSPRDVWRHQNSAGVNLQRVAIVLVAFSRAHGVKIFGNLGVQI